MKGGINIIFNREPDQLKTQIYGSEANGTNPVSIRVVVSATKTGPWILNTSALTEAVDEATVFVPKYFLRYATISYAATGAAETI
jgi:hypothetical protein